MRFAYQGLAILFIGALLLASGCGAKSGPSAAMDDAAAVDKTWPPKGQVPELALTPADKLVVVRTAEKLATDNPYAKFWQDAPYLDVPVLKQNVASPQLAEASVASVRVQAVTDGDNVAWRLSWDDPTPDGVVDSGQFSDGVAIEFPIDLGAIPMMGHRGAKVQILYWKAQWQKDLDVGFQDVQDLHPNYWADLYWFAEGEFPYPIPQAFEDPRSLQWFIAHEAGNPMAVFSRTQPVEELVAEGFGTLTHQPESASRGKGVWTDGRWAVVITRPLKTSDPLDHQFAADGPEQVAFAVWQGSDENVGGRKHWTNWIPFTVQP
ncbi:MAG: ethylbenzene dehydrogenase-related protein [Deltaproteobacteria bacterium]|nr:ethylbenzene dehydrogenase-related protein [Deltaproteobacteria bacterium]